RRAATQSCRANLTRIEPRFKTPPTPGSKRSQSRRLVTLAMTVYTARDDDGKPTRRVVHVPLLYARPLPADGRIQQIVLTRRRGDRSPSGDWRYEVVFTLRVPEPAAKATGSAAAIHIGWRTVDQGVRVATVADQHGVSYFVLPGDLAARFELAAETLSRADSEAEAMRADLATRSHLQDAPPTVQADMESVRRARSGAGIARAMRWMARNWKQHAADYCPADLADLATWSHADLETRWMARNIQANAVRHRRALVRTWVAELADRYYRVIVQTYDISRLRRRNVVDEALPSARRNVQRMAPGEIRAAVTMTLKSRGVLVVPHADKATWCCHVCGAEQAPSDPLALRARCPGCGAAWDVDDNAAKNALGVLVAGVADGDGATVATTEGRFAKRRTAAAAMQDARSRRENCERC
ncbi:MAG: hypothetical protein WCJ64_14320, partial [Rhodospirillaceae bacterium]